MTIIHVLKCWPEYYQAISQGLKTWEIRKNDRYYRVGDILHLRSWDPETRTYLPGELRVRVTYLTGLSFLGGTSSGSGLPGYVGMSIELMAEGGE